MNVHSEQVGAHFQNVFYIRICLRCVALNTLLQEVLRVIVILSLNHTDRVKWVFVCLFESHHD